MNKISLHQKVLVSLILAFVIGLLANNQRDYDWVVWLIQTCEFVGKLF